MATSTAAPKTIGSGIPSGTKKIIRKVALQFWEYGGLISSCQNNPTIPNDVFFALKECTAGKLAVKGNDTPKLIKGKWIYIFKKYTDSLFSLSYELKTDVSDNKQVYKIVSWTKDDAAKWASTYPRTLLGKTYDNFTISNDIDYYVVLSREQLTYKRVVELYKNPRERILPRALHIPANLENTDGQTYPLYLLDYLSAADSLRLSCGKSVSDFERFTSDTEKAKNRYLCEMIHSLQNVKKDISKWLDYSRSESYRKNQADIFKSLETNKKNGIGRLEALLSSDGYRETLDDYNGTKELEELICKEYGSHIELMDADPNGLEYLKRTMADTQGWLSRYFTADEPFLFHRKLSTLAADEVFMELLMKYAIGKALNRIPPKVKISVETLHTLQEKIVVEINSIITRASIVVPELVQKNGNYFWVAKDSATRTVTIKYELKVMSSVTFKKTMNYAEREAARAKWREGVEAAQNKCQRLLLVIEIINLYSAVNSLSQSENIKEFGEKFVDFVGSLSDSIGAAKFLLQKKLMYKLGSELTDKFFSSVTVVGAICDYVGALQDIYQASSEKNYALAAAYSTIALAAVAGGAGGAVALSGAGATAFGLSASTLGLIGVALFVVGATLVWVFTEEELEKWAKKSKYGERYESGYSVDKQIRDLHEILCSFNVECFLFAQRKKEWWDGQGRSHFQYDYFFTLKIHPGLLNDKSSKFVVDFSIKHTGGLGHKDEMIFNNKLTLPDSKTYIQRDKGKDGPIKYLMRQFGEQELSLVDHFEQHQFEYAYSAQLDLNGDGSEKFPEKPKCGNGTFETRGYY